MPGSQESLLAQCGITLAADFHVMLQIHVCFTLYVYSGFIESFFLFS